MHANVGKPDQIARCLLQHRNTPMKGCKVSPAQLVMGRGLRDFIPQPPSGYSVSNRWKEFLRQREQYMLKNNDKIVEQKKKLILNELPLGCKVSCQNVQNNQWDKSGIIVEVLAFRKYKIKLHGSGRITTRNRIHLRHLLFKPVIPLCPRSSLNPKVSDGSTKYTDSLK